MRRIDPGTWIGGATLRPRSAARKTGVNAAITSTMILIAFSILAGYSPPSRSDEVAEPAPESSRECFWSRNLVGWKAGGRDVLAIRVSGGRYYRFHIRGFCPDLRFARAVAFGPRDSRICGDPGDFVRVERQRCFLDDMQPISQDDYRKLGESRKDAGDR